MSSFDGPEMLTRSLLRVVVSLSLTSQRTVFESPPPWTRKSGLPQTQIRRIFNAFCITSLASWFPSRLATAQPVHALFVPRSPQSSNPFSENAFNRRTLGFQYRGPDGHLIPPPDCNDRHYQRPNRHNTSRTSIQLFCGQPRCV